MYSIRVQLSELVNIIIGVLETVTPSGGAHACPPFF